MSPYEIVSPGGSVEHLNPEPGKVWLERAIRAWPRSVWINPTPEVRWNASHSSLMVAEIFQRRMFPLTPDGVEARHARARCLNRPRSLPDHQHRALRMANDRLGV